MDTRLKHTGDRPQCALGIVLALVLLLAGCGSDRGPGDGVFPDVIAVTADQSDDGTWRFDVTLSSPYDTPDRYADAWRILGPDGTEYGVRELAHDHANEQPFTRSLSGVEIPDEVDSVVVEGRDQVNGWGGEVAHASLAGDEPR